jgi:hypothetical protein
LQFTELIDKTRIENSATFILKSPNQQWMEILITLMHYRFYWQWKILINRESQSGNLNHKKIQFNCD